MADVLTFSSSVEDIEKQKELELFSEALRSFHTEYWASDMPFDLAPFEYSDVQITAPNWFVYSVMLKDQATKLAGDVNCFLHRINTLAAWSKVLPNYDFQKSWKIRMWFVDAVMETCLNYPAAIKDRLVFSVSHLSHQANLAMQNGWEESKLPKDREIKHTHMDQVSKNWQSYSSFKTALAVLNNKAYKEATLEYRNKYSHRVRPHIEQGLNELCSRNVCKDSVTYGIGGRQPLKLEELVKVLQEQHDKARKCFDAYSELIKEHLKTV